MKKLGKCGIEEIPPKVLERSRREEGVDLGVTLKIPGHFCNGRPHDVFIVSKRKETVRCPID